MANDKKEFVLRHTFTGPPITYGSSPIETHFGVPWQMTISNSSGCLDFHLYCKHSSKSNLWKIDVIADFGIISKNGEFMRCDDKDGQSLSHTFTKNNPEGGFVSSAKIDEFVENCMMNGEFTVETRVKITGMTGISIKKKVRNFNEPNGKMTDVCLVVDGKKFHASKTMLAENSPVFEAMFFGEFVEAESKEVVIKDTNADSFEVFLSFIYNVKTNITASNLEELMRLADRYDVTCVFEKCEEFLISSKNVEIAEKLKLSEKYSLETLQKQCLDGLKKRTDLSKLMSKIDDMGPQNLKALLEKAHILWSKYE